jgi:hypothetical protein
MITVQVLPVRWFLAKKVSRPMIENLAALIAADDSS